MRVWLIHMGELVQSDGDGVRLYRLGMLAEELESRGHLVTRWVPTFIHTHKRQRFDNDAVVQVTDRHDIRHIYARGYKRHIGLGRLRFHREVARRWEALERELPAPDLILTSMPTPDIGSAARRIASRRHVPFVIDIRDLWPDALYDAVPSWLTPVARVATAPFVLRNRCNFRAASGITAVSNEYLRWGLSLAGRAASPSDHVFPPGYAPPRPPERDLQRARQSWQARLSPHKMVCLFLGTLSPHGFDLSSVVDAARQLERQQPGRFEWVICGDGPARSALERRAADLDHVHFPGWVDGADVVALLETASIGLAPYADGLKISMPNKPFEYAFGGMPVVSSLKGEMRDLLDELDWGTWYPAGDVQALAEAVSRYDATPELLARHGQAARALWRQRFAASAVYGRMADHLETVGRDAHPMQDAQLADG